MWVCGRKGKYRLQLNLKLIINKHLSLISVATLVGLHSAFSVDYTIRCLEKMSIWSRYIEVHIGIRIEAADIYQICSGYIQSLVNLHCQHGLPAQLISLQLSLGRCQRPKTVVRAHRAVVT